MWDSVSLNEQLGVFKDQFKKLLKEKLRMRITTKEKIAEENLSLM